MTSAPRTQNTFVLPGLDGTTSLLDEFRDAAPSSHTVSVLELPDDRAARYSELCDNFADQIRSSGSCTLIGESFSGPLAVLLANQLPHVVRHLVLVATVVTSPTPRIAAIIPWSLVFRLGMPRVVARRFFVGKHVGLIPAMQAAVKTHSPRTLARRLKTISKVDVRAELRELKCPITYIQATGDALVSAAHADAILQLNENVVVRQIEGPHLILQSCPEIAWQHIVETAPTAPSR